MVLPASPPDDASGPATPGWLRRLKVAFGLSRAGLLVLVDHARLERLGELVRTLLPLAPELEVQTEALPLADAAPGSAHVLIARAEDADWLNINRPLFSSRALRVVLFCTREVSVELLRKAVDFMDWVSLRLECPMGAPPFAVAGLRHALAARAPGIVWTGGDLEASFAEALPHRTLRRLSAARPYAELVAEAKAKGPREWLAWTDIEEGFQLRRLRWALAETKQRQNILVEPMVSSPGWWEVQGQLMEPTKSWMRLRDTGAQQPCRLAALVDLEPEAIRIMELLLKLGVSEHVLEEELLRGRDPGAAMGQFAVTKGLVTTEQWIRGGAPPPAMRALRVDRQLARRAKTAELEKLEARLKLGEQLDAEDSWWWSAWTRTYPSISWLENSSQWGSVAEVLLRRSHDAKPWIEVASIALALEDFDTAHSWSRHAWDADPANWRLLFVSLRGQGRLVDAESLLRQQLAQGGQTPNPEHSRLLYLLGDTLHKKGDFADAEQFLRQSITLLEQESLNPEYTAAIRVLALVCEEQGNYKEAEALLRKSLTLNEEASGNTSPRSEMSRYELAIVLERQGRYAEAAQILQQCLVSTERLSGSHHPNYGAVLYTLARVREMQGNYADAEQLLYKSLSGVESALGTKHPRYGAILNQLSGILAQRGQYAEAEKLMRQVLGITAALSPAHEGHAVALGQLASILSLQGRDTEANELLDQALALEEQALGPRHPQLCHILVSYGASLVRQKRADGEQFLLRAVDIAQSALGPQHPETAQFLTELARAQALLKKPEAVISARKAVDGLIHAFGEEHPLVKASLPLLRRIIAGGE